ncbi:MAG: hypothetical protein KJ696_08760 [Gammaproteobacteria bacterium]|nr:hypothetical protein [Gammaproteobacteria bacterium]
MPTMNRRQIQQIEQRLNQWRAMHPDAASRRAAWRAKVLEFALNSTALENEPVDRNRVQALRTRPGR